jgi:hypothetical protein
MRKNGLTFFDILSPLKRREHPSAAQDKTLTVTERRW